MQETEETGVIYMITNLSNNKKYIGRVYSYEKHGRKPPTYYSADGRLKRHKSNVLSGNNEVPLLYHDMRIYGVDNFTVSTLEVCQKEHLKEKEKYYIRLYNTCNNDNGYNYLVGNEKPIDDNHVKKYKDNKVLTNKRRAQSGGLRQSDDVIGLPPNVYKRATGYFAQIKINGELYNKSFLSSNDSDEVKLQKAIQWINNIKTEHEDIVI